MAADWVVSKCKVGDVIVELKGKDVEHATKQVVATAKLWKQKGLCQGKLAGLIVCSQYPKASTSVQKKQQAFASEFSGQLHVRTRNREYDLEQLLGG